MEQRNDEFEIAWNSEKFDSVLGREGVLKFDWKLGHNDSSNCFENSDNPDL